MNTMVYGNLALKPMNNANLRVIDGSKDQHVYVVAQSKQLFAPDVYPQVQAPVSSRKAKLCMSALLISFISIAIVIALAPGYVRTQKFEHALSNTPSTTIYIASGDALWDIAQEHQVEGLSTSYTIELIKAWNKLNSATLYAGMELIVPA